LERKKKDYQRKKICESGYNLFFLCYSKSDYLIGTARQLINVCRLRAHRCM